MNNDENYQEKLKQLSNKVEDITSVNQKSFIPSFISKNSKPIYIYIGIPVILFLILILSKPKIIMINVKDEKTFFTESKISYARLLCAIIFVIIVEVIVYFIFNIKKKE